MVYISRLENRSFKKEINGILGPKISQGLDKLSQEQKTRLIQLLKKIDFEKWERLYDKPSSYVTNNNKWLSTLAWTIIGWLGTVIILLVVVLIFSCRMCVNLREIVWENIVVFVFVGAVEIAFFLFIASKYIPVEPSTITETMIDTLKKKF